MITWEYKQLRFDFKGRGITQELNILDIDGERARGWGDAKEVPTLPEMLTALGQDGWEIKWSELSLPLLQASNPMSEFEKLMKSGGSKRDTIKQRQQNRVGMRRNLLILLGVSFVLCFINIVWIFILIPLLIGVFIYQSRELMG